MSDNSYKDFYSGIHPSDELIKATREKMIAEAEKKKRFAFALPPKLRKHTPKYAVAALCAVITVSVIFVMPNLQNNMPSPPEVTVTYTPPNSDSSSTHTGTDISHSDTENTFSSYVESTLISSTSLPNNSSSENTPVLPGEQSVSTYITTSIPGHSSLTTNIEHTGITVIPPNSSTGSHNTGKITTSSKYTTTSSRYTTTTSRYIDYTTSTTSRRTTYTTTTTTSRHTTTTTSRRTIYTTTTTSRYIPPQTTTTMDDTPSYTTTTTSATYMSTTSPPYTPPSQKSIYDRYDFDGGYVNISTLSNHTFKNYNDLTGQYSFKQMDYDALVDYVGYDFIPFYLPYDFSSPYLGERSVAFYQNSWQDCGMFFEYGNDYNVNDSTIPYMHITASKYMIPNIGHNFRFDNYTSSMINGVSVKIGVYNPSTASIYGKNTFYAQFMHNNVGYAIYVKGIAMVDFVEMLSSITG